MLGAAQLFHLADGNAGGDTGQLCRKIEVRIQADERVSGDPSLVVCTEPGEAAVHDDSACPVARKRDTLLLTCPTS